MNSNDLFLYTACIWRSYNLVNWLEAQRLSQSKPHNKNVPFAESSFISGSAKSQKALVWHQVRLNPKRRITMHKHKMLGSKYCSFYNWFIFIIWPIWRFIISDKLAATPLRRRVLCWCAILSEVKPPSKHEEDNGEATLPLTTWLEIVVVVAEVTKNVKNYSNSSRRTNKKTHKKFTDNAAIQIHQLTTKATPSRYRRLHPLCLSIRTSSFCYICRCCQNRQFWLAFLASKNRPSQHLASLVVLENCITVFVTWLGQKHFP